MAELTEAVEAAMVVMYGDHPHAENYRAHVQLGITAAAELIVAATRRQVAEDIARAIETAGRYRCPTCGGKAASTTFSGEGWGTAPTSRCGGGHTWEGPLHHVIDPHKAAAIARGESGTTT